MPPATQVTVLPVKPAVRSDVPTTLDVLLTVTPAEPETRLARPKLNLGLVIDHSGSMAGARKIAYAQEAAAFAVQQLLPDDRVSVTIFDDRIDTIVPSTTARQKVPILDEIAKITPRGSTALHGGWREGAGEVGAQAVAGGLNRVLLLSDGLANVGVSDPDAIGTDVHAKSREGVSTTALGLGDDYNETLLEAMARAGDGNYYYVESPAQLPAIFAAELQGLVATTGTDVTLTATPAEGVTVADALNDFPKTPEGAYRLPNLIAGNPVQVVLRLNVPEGYYQRLIAAFELAWSAPGGGRMSATVALTLPAVTHDIWAGLAENADVRERATLLEIARAKKRAFETSARGDRAGTQAHLVRASALLTEVPATPGTAAEATDLGQIQAMLDAEEHEKFRKHAHYQSYKRSSSKDKQ